MALRGVLVLDAGTHSMRAGAFTPEGQRIGRFFVRPLSVREWGPKNRFKEQSGMEVLSAASSLLKEKAAELRSMNAGIEIAAIGTSGHMHADFPIAASPLPLAPLAPATMWNCQRNASTFEMLMNNPISRNLIIELTHNEPMMRGIFTKMLFRSIDDPQTWANTGKVLTTNNLLTWFLTGEYVMESSDGISAVDPTTNTYAEKLFKLAGLENKLPERIVRPFDIVGHLRAEVGSATGLSTDIVIAGGGGDQMTGLLGNGIVDEGTAGLNYGASGVVVASDPKRIPDPKGGIHFFGDWLMACCMATGLSVDMWEKKSGHNVAELATMAQKSSKPGANGARFYPWQNGMNHPVKGSNTSSSFVNFEGKSSHDQTRAIFEGVILEMVLCAKRMNEFGLAPFRLARLGGGGAKDQTGFIPQTFADMLGIPVVINDEPEASSLGAGIAAAVAGGIYPDLSTACKAMVHSTGEEYQPNNELSRLYAQMGNEYYKQIETTYPEIWARHIAK